MGIKEKIKNLVEKSLKNLSIETESIALEHPVDLKMGDYSTNIALALAKKLKTNPKELAEKIVSELSRNLPREISKVEVAGVGFINFYLSPEFFVENVKEILGSKNFGQNKNFGGQKFFIEHTQPNPFKEFHIGHLMNNTIGESVVRIVKKNGGKVKTCSYHGDVGLHVAKAIWWMKKQNVMPQDVATEVMGVAYKFGSIAYEEDPNARREIDNINKKIYNKEEEIYEKYYLPGRKISLSSFENIYEKLDSHFDYHFYESEAGEVGKKLVLDNLGKVFSEGEKGAVIFQGENFEPKTHTRVFMNSEKLPTYEAKEIGLAQIKKDKYEYDKSITITANEQNAFFNVVEVAIGEVFPELKGKLKHLSHGILRLPSGKMSSRTGDIITAESLMDQVKEKVLEKIKDREFSELEKNEVAEMVAIGAIKYSILHQSIGGDIIFDFEKAISFEGDSGPYLQYSYARARSVLEKAKAENIDLATGSPSGWEITEIEKILYKFPEIVLRSAQEFEPHYIANYLIELARAFNGFYGDNKIIDKNDPFSPYKIAMTEAFSLVLKNGLHLLGIKAPEKM